MERTRKTYSKAYAYDSLGNLTYERNSNNVHYDYKLNNLNQITGKTYGSNDKEHTFYTYDGRGNLALEQYGKLNGNGNGNGNGQRTTVGQYTYDETNKMVLGVNSSGESSAYLYNGLGALVEDTWKIAKNSYGYHDVDAGLEGDSDNGRGGGGSNGKGTTVIVTEATAKGLIIAVPNYALTWSQRVDLLDAFIYARDNGIQLILKVIN